MAPITVAVPWRRKASSGSSDATDPVTTPIPSSRPIPNPAWRWRARRQIEESELRAGADLGDFDGAVAARAASPTAMALNTTPRPAWDASAPIPGPMNMPIDAAPSVPPITDALLLSGDCAVSHASAPVHAIAPPTP